MGARAGSNRISTMLLSACVAVLAVDPANVSAGGPVAPEISGFAPLDQTDLVDHFTGDFRYSVPLMDVPGPSGGYPLSLTYASGIEPDQDASWVGLGWTLSPGAIVRQMRGLPDEFSGSAAGAGTCNGAATTGDRIAVTQDIMPSRTFGLRTGANFEFFGADSSVGTGLQAELKAYFDDYRGFGLSHTVGLSGQTKASGIGAGAGLSFTVDSLEGGSVGAQASLSLADGARFSGDIAFDPYRGLSGLGVGTQYSYQGMNVLNMRLDLMNFLGYAKPATLPATGREMRGSNISVMFKAGGEVYGGYIDAMMGGFYNEEHLAERETATHAFGFLHLDEATESDALDFNRERDGPIYDKTPNLAMPVLTNDLFVATGRDVTGTFRAYRNDAPVVFDPRQESELTGGAIGIDAGYGNLAKFGINGVVNHSSTVIKRWDGSNDNALFKDASNVFTGTATGAGRTYFKFIGEATAVAQRAFADPIRVPLSAVPFDLNKPPPSYFAADAVDLRLPPSAQRAPSAMLVEAFTYDDLRRTSNALPGLAEDYAKVRADGCRRPNHIGAFRITTTSGLQYLYGLASYNTRYEQHKFSVDRSRCPGGWCTTLTGLPARRSNQPATAAYDYADGPSAASEQFLEIKSLSAYPTSYLLTNLIGPDYVDADATPGPSDADYGYWVKFKYEKAPSSFMWRSPYAGASFVRGPENGRYAYGRESRRDQGTFDFGERESWYLSSIETATHIAYFCANKTARSDARGASGRRQETAPDSSAARSWRLDAVKLFTKSSLGFVPPASCAALAAGSLPLVEARLTYDNSLAKVPAADVAPRNQEPGEGKLTLRKVAFTHLGNARGLLSPYEFDYEDGRPEFNPQLRTENQNRWNTYQPRGAPPQGAAVPDASPPLDAHLAAAEQRDPQLDVWSSAWSLRRIVEPSARLIRVDYEADDYAYVQDKPAMRLFPITSVDSDRNGSGDARIDPAMTTPGGSEPARPRIYFRLDTPLPCGNPTACTASSAHVREKYVGKNRQLMFQMRVALKTSSTGVPAKWQTVSGYADLVSAGVIADGTQATSDIGWLELQPVRDAGRNRDYHPLAHAAWQYLRLEQPELIRDGGINNDPSGDAFKQAMGVLTLAEAIPELIAFATGLYTTWANNGWGLNVDLARSFVRLQDPDGIKKGGGARVKRIKVSDDWRASTGNTGHDLITGYEYSYRQADGVSSSGVAAYEPVTGGEENPLRAAKPFSQDVLLASSYNLFGEFPIGEAHYPAPVVGYSRITRRTLAAIHDATTLPDVPTSTGPTVYEFHTARDFPVRQRESTIDKRRNPAPQQVLIPFLGEITLNSIAASQGYTTIANDMHGKQKRVTTYEYVGNELDPATGDYPVRDEPVREVSYRYRQTGGVDGLSSDLATDGVPVTAPDLAGGVNWPGERRMLGENSDLVVDMRLNRTESFEAGIHFNLDVFLIAYFPIPITVPMPNFGYSLTEAKTVVTSRYIHRAGILESSTTRERSSRSTTQNLLFDPVAGMPVLSGTETPYGGTIYNYDIPARWTQARMGPAYDEVGRSVELSGGSAPDDRRVLPPPGSRLCAEIPYRNEPACLSEGTEIAIPNNSGGLKLTLINDGGQPTFVTTAGASQLGFTNLQGVVTRSGRRNLLSTGGDSIRALANPLVGATTATCRFTSNNDQMQVADIRIDDVLDASHVSFTDRWPETATDVRFAGSQVADAAAQAAFDSRDAFSRGARGIFRRRRDYVYVTERSQSAPEVDLAQDGTFTLSLFGAREEPIPCADGWRLRELRTRHSAAGSVAEFRDALDIPGASLFVSRGALESAVADNATRDEIAFESFEFFGMNALVTPARTGEGNFTFSAGPRCPPGPPACAPVADISRARAHTGRQSLRVIQDVSFPQTTLKLVPGKRYLVSAWQALEFTRVPRRPGANPSAGMREVRVDFKSTAGPPVSSSQLVTPVGPVIEGWQRIETTVSVPPGSSEMSLSIVGAGARPGATVLYLDDLRILPEDASLMSYVYEPGTLRMIASLDENNFATIFGYAPNGKVDSIRRETVRGILTESESRLHVKERP